MGTIETYDNDLTPTPIDVSTQQMYEIRLSYAGSHIDRNSYLYKKKDETVKEKLIRQRLAFSMFFIKPIFVPIDKNKFAESMNIESCNRVDKFKPKALNLIQKSIN